MSCQHPKIRKNIYSDKINSIDIDETKKKKKKNRVKEIFDCDTPQQQSHYITFFFFVIIQMELSIH